MFVEYRVVPCGYYTNHEFLYSIYKNEACTLNLLLLWRYILSAYHLPYMHACTLALLFYIHILGVFTWKPTRVIIGTPHSMETWAEGTRF